MSDSVGAEALEVFPVFSRAHGSLMQSFGFRGHGGTVRGRVQCFSKLLWRGKLNKGARNLRKLSNKDSTHPFHITTSPGKAPMLLPSKGLVENYVVLNIYVTTLNLENVLLDCVE